ncbi:MAG: TolC family protein, partial [Duodenibacillus sp.]
ALEETENALTAIRTAQTREDALQKARTSAETAADLAMQQYRAGLVDYQTVLNTQRTLLSAREDYQSNRADLANGLITLYRALGGGWKPSEAMAEEIARTEAKTPSDVSGS